MRIQGVALLCVHAMVMLVSGAAVDRYEGERHQHTAVINLLDTRTERRPEEGNTGVQQGNTGVQEGNTGVQEEEEEDEEYYDYYYEDSDEDEDDASGDYEITIPQVSMSRKPKDPSAILNADRSEGKRRRGKGKKKGKGKGKKRNPCMRKYKDFCIHGTCQYLRDIRAPSCVCHSSYSGERCQFFTLSVEGKTQEGYSRTTALAVVAVVLSSLCLTIIGLLLVLRFHKRGAYDVENEEKVKLGSAPSH